MAKIAPVRHSARLLLKLPALPDLSEALLLQPAAMRKLSPPRSQASTAVLQTIRASESAASVLSRNKRSGRAWKRRARPSSTTLPAQTPRNSYSRRVSQELASPCEGSAFRDTVEQAVCTRTSSTHVGGKRSEKPAPCAATCTHFFDDHAPWIR